MGKRAAATAANGGGKQGGKLWTRLAWLVLLLPLLAVLLPTCLVLGAMMLPTLCALLVDRARGRYLTITVGLLNFCGALPAVADLWLEGQGLGAALDELRDLLAWLMAYGSAAVGWAIYWMTPPLVASYYALATNGRLQALRRRQKALGEQWGDGVAALVIPRDDESKGQKSE